MSLTSLSSSTSLVPLKYQCFLGPVFITDFSGNNLYLQLKSVSRDSEPNTQLLTGCLKGPSNSASLSPIPCLTLLIWRQKTPILWTPILKLSLGVVFDFSISMSTHFQGPNPTNPSSIPSPSFLHHVIPPCRPPLPFFAQMAANSLLNTSLLQPYHRPICSFSNANLIMILPFIKQVNDPSQPSG